MSSPITRELARWRDPDIWLEDHGWTMMRGHFDFGGSSQGFGVCIDMEFVKRFMQVFNVEFLKQTNGQPCYVTHDYGKIYKVEPLFENEGKVFDVEEWANSRKKG